VTTVRCYVPLSAAQLAQLRDTRRLAGPLPGYAVTDEVRAGAPAGDRDEWEHTALQEAAAGVLASSAPVLLAAVDLEESHVDRGSTTGARIGVGDIDLPRVAALHLGDDVVSGDPAALPGPGEEVELSWYDTTEIDHVLDLVRARPER
jgi:hypothetical protein